MGAYISIPTWWQSNESRYRLLIGRCPECGGLNFPPEGACSECRTAVEYERVEPAGTGTVVAVTVVEGGAPPEFEQLLKAGGPFATAIIELDEGVRLPGMLTDCDPHAVERGDRVKAVVRRLYEQDGIVRYGTKFTPIEP
ncbi:Zn-ribbon domain-containing OB-fold protein (plasmid) [Haloferacaceae archaeon DSL9]